MKTNHYFFNAGYQWPIEHQQFKDSILGSKLKHEERFDQSNVEEGEQLVHLQTEMQKMVMDQMKLQQEFFERQEKGRHDQCTVKLPKNISRTTAPHAVANNWLLFFAG